MYIKTIIGFIYYFIMSDNRNDFINLDFSSFRKKEEYRPPNLV